MFCSGYPGRPLALYDNADDPSAALAHLATINAGPGPTDMQLTVEGSAVHLVIRHPATVGALRNLGDRIRRADPGDDVAIAAVQLWADLTAALEKFVEQHPGEPSATDPI
jgi:hypothetical protein